MTPEGSPGSKDPNIEALHRDNKEGRGRKDQVEQTEGKKRGIREPG